MADQDKGTDLQAPLAGAAIYQGLPIVLGPLLGDIPHAIAMATTSGEKLTADPGTPLRRLAEFTRSEVNAIQDFAKQQGVTMPIVAGGEGLEGAEMVDRMGPLRRLLARIAGDASATQEVVPHIALSQSSVPHAFHEIGHASPIAGSDTLRRTFQGLGRVMGQSSSIGNMLRAALAANVLAPPSDDASDTRKFFYNNAPALVGATMAPELLEEGRASLKAIQGAREHGVGVVRSIAELAPALGTYVAAAAAPVLATVLAKKIVAALQKKEETEKAAAAMQGAEVKAPGALRASASSAWKIGENPPKPKTIEPNAHMGGAARGRAQAKPPSKTAYYKDMLDTLYNPQRGSRLATPE